MTEEGELKSKIRRYLTGRNIYWANIQAGPGSKPGDPDMVICYNGRFIGLEAKTRKGVQSEIQRKRQREIEGSKGQYFIVRALDDVKKITEGLDDVESEVE